MRSFRISRYPVRRASIFRLVLLALLLTWLYETTNTLLAPILTHSLFNAVNFWWLLHEQALIFPV